MVHGSGLVQEAGDISGSGRVGSRFLWVDSGQVPKCGPECNSAVSTAVQSRRFRLLQPRGSKIPTKKAKMAKFSQTFDSKRKCKFHDETSLKRPRKADKARRKSRSQRGFEKPNVSYLAVFIRLPIKLCSRFIMFLAISQPCRLASK